MWKIERYDAKKKREKQKNEERKSLCLCLEFVFFFPSHFFFWTFLFLETNRPRVLNPNPKLHCKYITIHNVTLKDFHDVFVLSCNTYIITIISEQLHIYICNLPSLPPYCVIISLFITNLRHFPFFFVFSFITIIIQTSLFFNTHITQDFEFENFLFFSFLFSLFFLFFF